MPQWTKEQQNAMKCRNSRLLVSAAAGSGKTAVLVERIIRRITDPDSPVDVDHLLVMTFTKAAAAEMRSRILKGIEKRLDENQDGKGRDYERLKKQAALVDGARITTIDSFCLSVIREHTDLTDLDPAFRVGGQEELSLLREDIMEELLENAYAEKDPEFENFAQAFSQGKTDYGLSKLIFSVYDFAQSTPWPEEWLAKELTEAERESQTAGDPEQTLWMKYLIGEMHLFAEETAVRMDKVLALCDEEDGPSGYRPMIAAEREKCEALRKAEDFTSLTAALCDFLPFEKLGRNPRNTDKAKAERAKAFRGSWKDEIRGTLIGNFAFQDKDGLAADTEMTSRSVRVLIHLAMRFASEYGRKKREKNIVDFNDLEHMALSLLWEKDGEGNRVKSAVAEEYSRQFSEIYVDEYQDSNEVQEQLVRALDHGEVFMVGDVKQSIYAFRQARPELFTEKYRSYRKMTQQEEDGSAAGTAPGNYRIDLSKNFRSRKEILSCVNSCFRYLMAESLGGIDYDDDASLRYGADFPELPEGYVPGTENTETELLICDRKKAGPEESAGETEEETQEGETEEAEAAETDIHETEAHMAAEKIRQLTDPVRGLDIYDSDRKCYRKAVYSDIVILFRSQKGWAETFVNVLMQEGIPACAETNTGYFDTMEVKTVLSILSVIDNPLQDIPLAAFLVSPVAGMTGKELADIVSCAAAGETPERAHRLYERLVFASENSPDSLLREKCLAAIRIISTYAEKSVYLNLKELIREIYDETGYYEYASALPGGKIRKANLDMLLEKADDFTNTGYRGLFHFIRYIGNLKKYDTDFGEASLLGQHDNTVRLMSIHKSKGLEFPVCIVAGLGKKFNLQDTADRIIEDPVLGIGADCIDPARHIRGATLKKNVIAWRMKSESLGEELRILYVAMTRAKEKLILLGTSRDLKGRREKVALLCGRGNSKAGMTAVRSAQNELDWILMSMEGNEDSCGITVNPVSPGEFSGRSGEKETKAAERKERLQRPLSEAVPGEGDFPYLDAVYPHQADVDLHAKMSVSELKERGQNEDGELSAVPAFLSGNGSGAEGEKSGSGSTAAGAKDAEAQAKKAAHCGTVYHRVMEKLDYSRACDKDAFLLFLKDLREKNVLTGEEISCIVPEDFVIFAGTELGKRMAEAFRKGKLKRESQFVMTLPASETDSRILSDETVLIQGIIDAYFEEGDGIVLVDYKTDHVSSGEELKDRYGIQLKYYARALEMMKKKPVREKIIWSFALKKAISL